MIRRRPRSPRADTLFPYTTLLDLPPPPLSRLFSPYPPPTAPARPSREQGRQEEARQVAQRQGHSYDPLVLPPIHAAGRDRPSIPAHGHGEARANQVFRRAASTHDKIGRAHV